MHIKNVTPSLITALFVLANTSANAQDVSTIPFDKSVTVYSLDAPAEPVQYEPLRERPAPRSYTNTTPRTQSTASNVQSKAPSTKTVQEPAEIAQTGWLGADWSGRANLGASLQTGNTEQDAINADATVKAKWDDIHRATVKLDYNRETEDSTTTEDNRSIEGMYDYFFRPQWFFNTNAKAEQDDISDLDLRLTAGIGLGHQPFEGDDLNLQYVLGPSYLYEEFEDGSDDSSMAFRWALDYDQKVIEDKFQLFHEHEIIIPSDDTEGFLLDSKSGVRMPIIKGIVGTAEIDFDWDNDPEPGIKEEDTTYALKLGYEW